MSDRVKVAKAFDRKLCGYFYRAAAIQGPDPLDLNEQDLAKFYEMRDEILALIKGEPVAEMTMCESERVIPRPNELYRYRVDTTCPECVRVANQYDDMPPYVLAPQPERDREALEKLRRFWPDRKWTFCEEHGLESWDVASEGIAFDDPADAILGDDMHQRSSSVVEGLKDLLQGMNYLRGSGELGAITEYGDLETLLDAIAEIERLELLVAHFNVQICRMGVRCETSEAELAKLRKATDLSYVRHLTTENAKLREALGQIRKLPWTLDAPVGDEARLDLAGTIATEALEKK